MTLRMYLSVLILVSAAAILPLCGGSRATVSGFAERIERIVELRNQVSTYRRGDTSLPAQETWFLSSAPALMIPLLDGNCSHFSKPALLGSHCSLSAHCSPLSTSHLANGTIGRLRGGRIAPLPDAQAGGMGYTATGSQVP